MLPETQHDPTLLLKDDSSAFVSSPIRLELLSPPSTVPLRKRSVDGAAMPETTVDEDCDPCLLEDDVRPGAHPGNRLTIDSITQTPSVNDLAECNLRGRVAPPRALHPPPHGGGRWQRKRSDSASLVHTCRGAQVMPPTGTSESRGIRAMPSETPSSGGTAFPIIRLKAELVRAFRNEK